MAVLEVTTVSDQTQRMNYQVQVSLTLLLCLFCGGLSHSQEPAGLTRVLVTAMDENGEIGKLKLEDITLRKNGNQQAITDFKVQINAPTSLAVMIDTGHSQERLLPLSKSTARVFVKGFIRPGRDRASIISFADKVLVRQSLTDDVETLRSAIDKIKAVSPFVVDVSNGKVPDAKKPVGITALMDAITFACNALLSERVEGTRKAIILFSAGIDSTSATKTAEAIDVAVRNDIAIFAIGLPVGEKGALSLREDQAKLRRLAQETGGRAYFPAKNEELESILGRIEKDLRAQYIITFPSDSMENKKDRELKIEIVNPQKKRENIQLAYRRRY